jgi:hypothetical protein
MLAPSNNDKRKADTKRRKQAWRARQLQHRRNPVDYFPVPLDRETQWLLGITDNDRENRKAVGEAIAKRLSEVGEKDFGNAFRCPHCGGSIFQE